MSLFSYEVLDKSGNLLTGKLEAEHELAAADRLRKMGYTVIVVEKVRRSLLRAVLSNRRNVSTGELGLFSRQLAAMLAAGIPLTRSLYALSEQTSNPTLGSVVNEAARNVEGGMDFSESLRAYPEVFSPMYVDMVKAGEVGGALEDVLLRLSEQLERDRSLKDSIRAATMYPMAVLAFAGAVTLIILLFIVPAFVNMFPPDIALPLPTRVIVSVSESLRTYWYVYMLVLGVVLFGLRLYLASDRGRDTWERIRFRLPIFGALLHKTTIARMARTLSTLLSGGVPVIQALEVAGPASGSKQIADAVLLATEMVQEGQSLVGPLRQSKVFPAMVTMMVGVGEETGELPSMLGRVADFYEAEVATMSKQLASLIEPVLIVTVGCIIGFLVVSLYLPIFTAITQVR
ncbi:MAG: type II secretion system F family protein [Bacillota bacterium]